MKNFLRKKMIQVMIWLLILAFFVLMLWPRIFITIKPGEAGVLWLRFSDGTVLDQIYGEGTRVIFPWDKMYIYTVRQQTESRQAEVLTKYGLRIMVDYSVRYKPEYDLLAVLHAQIGPDYLQRMIIPEVESSLRHTVGNFTSDELYSAQNDVVATLRNQALEAVAHRYVHVDNINIRKINLPDPVKDAIESKLVQAEVVKAYKYKLEAESKEAERRKIEAEGLKVANEILSSSISANLLRFKGIKATTEISKSENSKVIIIGSGKDGLPIILGGDR